MKGANTNSFLKIFVFDLKNSKPTLYLDRGGIDRQNCRYCPNIALGAGNRLCEASDFSSLGKRDSCVLAVSG